MTFLAAAGALARGNWLGSITLSGIAAVMALALYLGVRGSDRIKINTKERITGWGLVTGSMCLAAGGNWADVVSGIGSIPSSAVEQSGFASFGDAGMGACLVLLAIGRNWGRKWVPAVLSLAAAKFLIDAGGLGAVVLNAARVTLGHLGGTG